MPTLDVEIIRLNAYWDQVQAMIRDFEAEHGPSLPLREELALARTLIDRAAELEDAPS